MKNTPSNIISCYFLICAELQSIEILEKITFMLFCLSLRASIKHYLENIAEIVTTYPNRFLLNKSTFVTRKSHTEFKTGRCLFLLYSVHVVDWKLIKWTCYHFPNVFQSTNVENLLSVRREELGSGEWEYRHSVVLNK